MATKQIKVDDIDGKTEGAETLFFSVDDVFYRIDLAPANHKKLTDTLQTYIDKAQRTEAPRGGKRTPASEVTGNGYGTYDPAVVRAWAVDNDIQVSEKCRVPEDIVSRWREATKTKAA